MIRLPSAISSAILALFCVAGGAGLSCDGPEPNGNGQQLDCPDAPTLQLSPSGQALAIVDAVCFDDLLSRSNTEPTMFLQGTVEAYVNLFAESYPNDADFVMFTLDAHRERLRFTAVGGFNIAVDIPEAGLGPFVAVQTFPNLPELRSYIYLARKDSLVLGPSLHELAHGWGVRFLTPDALAQQASQSDNHWGFTSAGGQMGGWMPGTLMDLGNGEFELSSGQIETGGRSFNTVPFSAIELYIMGLAEQDEVQPLQVAVNPVPRSLFEFVADDIVEVTIEDIVAANGARVPNAQDAQRAFKIALVVLTDHLLSEREWDFYQDSIDYFAFNGGADINEAFPESRYAGQPIREFIAQPDLEDPSREFMNFFEATRGRATLEFIPLQATGP